MPKHFLSDKKKKGHEFLHKHTRIQDWEKQYIHINVFVLPSRNFQHLRRVEETYFKCCMTNPQDGLTLFRLMLAWAE